MGRKWRFQWKVRTPERSRSASLLVMQQANPSQPHDSSQPLPGSSASRGSSHFAGLLAKLTMPQPGTASAPALWNEGDLGEDVATLSYESALRAHARYHSRTHGDSPVTQHAELRANDRRRATEGSAVNRAGSAGVGFHAEAAEAARTGHDGDLKRASVTVRFSPGEAEQLRRRSAEAGLTVSAYLRSCAFEVEGLRAQVKDALATMRSNGSTAEPAVRTTERRAGSGWLALFRWLTRLVERERSTQSSRPITPLAARGI